MADKLAGGNLARLIRDGRDAGDSLAAIARRLFADHGIEVTDQTVNNWLTVLAEEEAVA